MTVHKIKVKSSEHVEQKWTSDPKKAETIYDNSN